MGAIEVYIQWFMVFGGYEFILADLTQQTTVGHQRMIPGRLYRERDHRTTILILKSWCRSGGRA